MTREEAERVLRDVVPFTLECGAEAVWLKEVLSALEALPNVEAELKEWQEGHRYEAIAHKKWKDRAEKAEAERDSWKRNTEFWKRQAEPARLREAFVAGAEWAGWSDEYCGKPSAEAFRRYPDAQEKLNEQMVIAGNETKPSPLMRCEAAERCRDSGCVGRQPHLKSSMCCEDACRSPKGFPGSVCKPVEEKWKPAEEVLQRLRDLPLPEDDILSGFCVDDWTGNQQDNLRTLARRIEERIAERLENHVDQLNDIHKSIADHEKRVAELEGKK